MNRTGVKFQRIEEYARWFENILQTDLVSYLRFGNGKILEFESTFEAGDILQLDMESALRPHDVDGLCLWSELVISNGVFTADLSKYIKPQKEIENYVR